MIDQAGNRELNFMIRVYTYPSLWAAIESIAPKIGCVPQTLNDWGQSSSMRTDFVLDALEHAL